MHSVIQFNQEGWQKSYIDMNTELRKEAKNEFEKDFFKLMNNSVLRKAMENVRNQRDIKLVTTNKKRNILVSEPSYHTTKHIIENLLIIEVKKQEVKMNKPIYLGISILDIMITLNRSMEIEQNYVTLILTVLLFLLKLKIFTKKLLMMLKDGLTHLTMMRIMKDHFQ